MWFQGNLSPHFTVIFRFNLQQDQCSCLLPDKRKLQQPNRHLKQNTQRTSTNQTSTKNVSTQTRTKKNDSLHLPPKNKNHVLHYIHLQNMAKMTKAELSNAYKLIDKPSFCHKQQLNQPKVTINISTDFPLPKKKVGSKCLFSTEAENGHACSYLFLMPLPRDNKACFLVITGQFISLSREN